MRLGWTTGKYSTTYRAVKTVRINGKNKTQIVKSYTIDQILPTLQEMDFMKYEGKGYQPVYTRTELTDALHDAFGFCTSKQIVPIAKMRNICSQTKK